MKFFKKFLIWSHLITVLILVLFFIQNQKLQRIWNKHNNVHLVGNTLYLDRAFTEDEKYIIMEAAYEWQTKTNNIVKYDIVSLPCSDIHLDNAIIIIKGSEDYPEVIALDLLNKNYTLGYYNRESYIPSIFLISNRLTSNYKSVVLHELGHSLGLKHNEGIDGINTLMYPIEDFSADHVTKNDLINFCKLYKCDVNSL